jgi:hypothetical protein
MTKLKLDLETLRVASFATTKADERRGTVNAASTYTSWWCQMSRSCG